MKKILIFLLLTIPFLSNGQVYQKQTVYGISYYRALFDSSFHVPLFNSGVSSAVKSNLTTRKGAIAYDTVTDRFYFSTNGTTYGQRIATYSELSGLVTSVNTHTGAVIIDTVTTTERQNWDSAYANKVNSASFSSSGLSRTLLLTKQSGDILYPQFTIPDSVSNTERANWDSSYVNKINSLNVTGTGTKSINLVKQNGVVVSGTFTDINNVYTGSYPLSVAAFDFKIDTTNVTGVATKSNLLDSIHRMRDSINALRASIGSGGGGGSVTSVNTQTGAVVIANNLGANTDSLTTVSYPNINKISTYASPHTVEKTLKGVNMMTTGSTTMFTTESGLGRFVVTYLFVHVTSAVGQTGTFTFTLGYTGVGYIDIVQSANMAAATYVTNEYFWILPSVGVCSSVPASTALVFNKTGAWTGSSATADVTVYGFYIK